MTNEQPWVVVQAGGKDTHLQSLTRALCGRDLPTQLAVIAGEKSLLQSTIELAATITQLDRVLVVVSAPHAEIARVQITPYPGVEMIIQPRDLDTAPALLLPVARILERDPLGRVVLLPADHKISNPGPLLAAIRASELGRVHDQVTLIGVTPTNSELEHGWIVCGQQFEHTGAYEVRRPWELPLRQLTERLLRRGGLWNTFIAVGQITTFWDLARAYLPDHASSLEQYIAAIGTVHEGGALRDAYARMTPASFSRDVLAWASGIVVIPVAGSGWSHWESPREVVQSLEGTPLFEQLLVRLRNSTPSPVVRAS